MKLEMPSREYHSPCSSGSFLSRLEPTVDQQQMIGEDLLQHTIMLHELQQAITGELASQHAGELVALQQELEAIKYQYETRVHASQLIQTELNNRAVEF